MDNLYKILGLKFGATLNEVEEKYNELLIEFDPNKQSEDLREFFTSERQKVIEAYKEISAGLINTESVEQKMGQINPDTNEINTENIDLNVSLAEEIESDDITVDNNFNTQINHNNKEKHVFRNVLLFFIAAGVWGMFLQNMGVFVAIDDYTQKVEVVNTVDTEVQGRVSVNGSVSVDNTVDINIAQINGYTSFYDSNGDKKYRRIPVYTFN
jgi:hypothetical protein